MASSHYFNDRNFTDIDCLRFFNTSDIVQTCLVLVPGTTPAYAISVAAVHFAAGGLALLCAVGFIVNVSLSKKVMLAMGSKQPTDKISFFVAPLLCCIFCFCSLVHGLSTFPIQTSSTYSSKHIGCECLASVEAQNARYILHSFVVPLILIVAFEQSYVIHKRKTAKFCCIGFDRGHRLKAKNLKVQFIAMTLRYTIWFIAGGLAIFNLIMNTSVVTKEIDLRKQQRFTYKSLIEYPQAGDLVEFIFMGIFTLYFGFSLWNYGKNYSMNMTAMPCNRWMMMLIGSIFMVISNLLPSWISPFTADISISIYLVTVILLEKEVLEDMSRLLDWKDGKTDGGKKKNKSGDEIPGWAKTKVVEDFHANVMKEMEQNEKRSEDEKVAAMESNPMRQRQIQLQKLQKSATDGDSKKNNDNDNDIRDLARKASFSAAAAAAHAEEVHALHSAAASAAAANSLLHNTSEDHEMIYRQTGVHDIGESITIESEEKEVVAEDDVKIDVS